MRFSRDLLVVVLLFIVLIGLTTVLAVRQAEAEREQNSLALYSSHSAQNEGALALYDWLALVGYRPLRLEASIFRVSAEARALLVFTPRQDYTVEEARAVRQWVEQGNTLIFCDSSTTAHTLWREFQADLSLGVFAMNDLRLEQPVAGNAPVVAHARTGNALKLLRSDYVTYLSSAGKPLLVSFNQGKGHVWLCTVPGLFTNNGLRNDGNAALVGVILSETPRGSAVAFDEFHLNPTRPRASLQELLYTQPWGWAILYCLILVFAFLVVNGRRFGRVVPLPQEIARRNPAEYVVSLAQLFRRAGKREVALRHYRQQLKRRLGRPYALNAALPDDEFVAALGRVRERLDHEALRQTLRGLSQTQVDERTLIRLADQATRSFTNKG